MDVKDPFRDLAFDGRPAGYRESDLVSGQS
jgi:hypothetical protein